MKKILSPKIIVVFFIISVIGISNAEDVLVEYFPEDLLSTATLLELKRVSTSIESDSVVFFPIGSVVNIYHNERYYFLTAKHLVEGIDGIYLRSQISSDSLNHIRISIDSILSQGTKWQFDSSADIAALQIDLTIIRELNLKCISTSTGFAANNELELGTGVYVIGHPTLISRIDYHIVRNGIIASTPNSEQLLVDAQVYPGNSGGPVFLKAIRGLKLGAGLNYKGKGLEGRQPKLVGFVIQYLSYTDTAISQRTKRRRITFEENSGLAVILHSPRILEFLNTLDSTDSTGN